MTKPRREFQFVPRAMSADLAAWYVGQLGLTAFTAEMKAHGVEPVKLRGARVVYFREDLDAYLDHKAGRSPLDDPDDAALSEELKRWRP